MRITVQQPQPYDIVTNDIQIAGLVGGAFEATYVYAISDGHDEVLKPFTVGGDVLPGQYQFQITADVTGSSLIGPVVYLEVFHTPPKDGSPERADSVVIPIILGSLIMPDYKAYIHHEISRGETLWGLAQHYYSNGTLYHRLLAANPSITDSSLIHPGDIIRVPLSEWPV